MGKRESGVVILKKKNFNLDYSYLRQSTGLVREALIDW